MASTIRQKAEVTVTVNGRNAQLVLDGLQKKAEGLRKAIEIEEKAAAPDAKKLRDLQKQLRDTEKLMANMQSSTAAVEKMLRNLDQATPKELKKAIREMERNLQNVKHGTEEWKKQTAVIRQAKDRLAQMNGELRQQQTHAEKILGIFNKWQVGIMGAVAAMGGLIAAGRKAVKEFSAEEEFKANTKKYTGMSDKDVEKLNANFKHMDTRLGREELNLLAQEAGRLGKNNLKSVQEYVEAAQVIKVALVDLGADATQTISKLTNIFGVEQLMGTKKAMLSVGSAVNVLSQNCTASKDYLVEFAQRMAGIGASAGMSIPQILAFAAVLDANGQKVEMSATAIQKVIMKLASKSNELAGVVGLDAQKLSDTMNKSAKDGLLMFLEALERIGKASGYDNAIMALAPAFSDLGMDAARVAQVLATLSGHLPELRSQLGEADKAFREASSASKEFAIFNNTVEAEMSKAREAVTDIARELGEKLYPLMRHIMRSSTAFLKVLSNLVSFVINHHKALIGLAATMAALVAVEKADLIVKGLKMLSYKNLRAAVMATNVAKVLYMATTSKTTLAQMRLLASSRLLRAMFFAVQLVTLLLAKATGTLSGVQQRTIATSKALQAAMAATPWGLLIVGITAGIVALTKYMNKQKEAAKAERERIEEIRKRRAEYTKVSVEQSAEETKELARLKMLREAISNETLTRDQRLDAAKKMISIYPSYFKNMSAEQMLAADLSEKYEAIEKNILKAAAARAVMSKIEENYQTQIGLTEDLDNARKEYDEADRLYNEYDSRMHEAYGNIPRYNDPKPGGGRYTTDDIKEARKKAEAWKSKRDEQARRRKAAGQVIKETKPEIAALENSNKYLTMKYGRDVAEWEKAQESGGGTGTGTGGVPTVTGGGTGGGGTAPEIAEWFTDAMKELQARRDQAVFRADVARAMGEIDFRTQKDRTHDAESAYFADAIRLYTGRFAEASGGKDYRTNADYMKLVRDSIAKQAERDKILSDKTKSVLERMRDIDLREVEADAKSSDGSLASDAELRQRRMKIWDDYYSGLLTLHEDGSEEYYRINLEWERKLEDDRLEVRQQLAARLAEVSKKEFEESWVKEWRRMQADIATLKAEGLIDDDASATKAARDKARKESGALPSEKAAEKREREKAEAIRKADTALREGIISKEEYARRIAEIEKEFGLRMADAFAGVDDQWIKMMAGLYDAISDMVSAFQQGSDDALQKTGAAVAASAAIVGAAFEQVGKFAEANDKIREKRINDYYTNEIELAEGNTRTVKRLEKEKEREIADMKKKASEKQFAMQVVAAIAQTATNALNAYGSAAAIPVVGHILAPIAAAAAVAAGMLQVAAIKKQQQAAAATGYAVGGYTGPGKRDDVAGVVHAGEWVAPAYMVNDPQTGAVIAALEQARVSHRAPSLTAEAVDRRLSAPAALAAVMGSAAASAIVPTVAGTPAPAMASSGSGEEGLAAVLDRLADRLDRPFVTVNTVTGDFGIKQAQDKYDRFIKNKSK